MTCHSRKMWSPSAAAAGGAEPEAVEKYAAKYSASVDPFAAWRAKAAEERRASMGVHDRLLYSAAQLVSAHPAARLFVCVYTLLLHFLASRLHVLVS